MGLFDDNTSRKRDEVRIGVAEQEESDSKLESDVESRIGGSGDPVEDGSEVSLEEIRDQNERIIELLESIVKDKPDIGGSESISDRRNNSRENSREDDNQGMKGGMDELL